MNERLSLQDLIDLLAKKQEMTKKDAETFLRELVAVITENIEAGESVKIKDLGTFKLLKVNARKSVDVNTGESIEIAAHYKLSFNPDKLLKEAVNRPFAHFESVVLEEGVTFDNIENEIEEEKGAEAEDDDIAEYIPTEPKTVAAEEAEEKAVHDRVGEQIAEKREPDVLPVGIIDADIAKEEVVEELASEVAKPETKPVPYDIINKIVEEAAAHNVNVEDILLVIKENKQKEKEQADKIIEEDDNLVYEDVAPQRTGMRKRYIILILTILLIIAGFVIGGLYFQEIVSCFSKNVSGKEINMPVTEMPVSKPQVEAILKDTLAPKQDTVRKYEQTPNSLYQDRDSHIQAPPPPSVGPVNGVESNASALSPITVETIQPGHTLRNIALKYYGNKSFWVYIYEENKSKITNVNNVPLGTKLTIPAPVKYGINPQNEESVKKAMMKEEALFKQMDIAVSGK